MYISKDIDEIVPFLKMNRYIQNRKRNLHLDHLEQRFCDYLFLAQSRKHQTL